MNPTDPQPDTTQPPAQPQPVVYPQQSNPVTQETPQVYAPTSAPVTPDPLQASAPPSVQPQYQPQPVGGSPIGQPQVVSDPGKTLAIVSLVVWFLGLSLVGLICAIVSRKKTRGAGLPTSTLATVALILNIVGLVVSAGVIILLVLTTYTGIQQKARNTKRQVDVSSIQTQVEANYSANGYYPSLKDLNSSSWRSKNMKGLDTTALADPSNPSVMTLASSPVSHQYAYQVTDKNGASCEEADTKCAKYTLTATYEGTNNGESTLTKQSLN